MRPLDLSNSIKGSLQKMFHEVVGGPMQDGSGLSGKQELRKGEKIQRLIQDTVDLAMESPKSD